MHEISFGSSFGERQAIQLLIEILNSGGHIELKDFLSFWIAPDDLHLSRSRTDYVGWRVGTPFHFHEQYRPNAQNSCGHGSTIDKGR